MSISSNAINKSILVLLALADHVWLRREKPTIVDHCFDAALRTPYRMTYNRMTYNRMTHDRMTYNHQLLMLRIALGCAILNMALDPPITDHQ